MLIFDAAVEKNACLGAGGPLHECVETQIATMADVAVGVYNHVIVEKFNRSDSVVDKRILHGKVEIEFGFDEHVSELHRLAARTRQIGVAIGYCGRRNRR